MDSESKSARIEVRTSEAFKANTLQLIKQLCAAGLREQVNMSQYTLDAVKEKRERDMQQLEQV